LKVTCNTLFILITFENSSEIFCARLKLVGNFKYLRQLHDKFPLSPTVLTPIVFVKDVTLLDEGNQDRIDGLINYDKYKMLSDIILRIRKSEITPYPYEAKGLYQNYLGCLPFLDSKKLDQIMKKSAAK